MDFPAVLETHWDVLRIITSERFSESLIEIERDWTMADVERASLTLDVLEDVDFLAVPKKKR